MLSRLKFWWTARNRHGVHSPFIYRFLDAGLYRKDLRKLPPEQRLLIAVADHFQPDSAWAAEPGSRLAAWLRKQRTGIRWDPPPADLILCDSPEEALTRVLDQPGLWHNDSILFVGGLRRDSGSRALWKQCCRLPRCRVILETYDAGLIFFRRQQVPQHFRIRN